MTRVRTPLAPTAPAGAAALAGVVGAGCVLTADQSTRGILAGAVAAVLIWLAALDIEFRLLPNRIVLPAAALVLAARMLLQPAQAPHFAAWSLGTALALLVAARIRPGGLGMGDVKLGLLLGVALGGGTVAALAIGFASVGVTGVALAVRQGRQALKRTLPLGPFLAFGAITMLLLHAGR